MLRPQMPISVFDVCLDIDRGNFRSLAALFRRCDQGNVEALADIREVMAMRGETLAKMLDEEDNELGIVFKVSKAPSAKPSERADRKAANRDRALRVGHFLLEAGVRRPNGWRSAIDRGMEHYAKSSSWVEDRYTEYNKILDDFKERQMRQLKYINSLHPPDEPKYDLNAKSRHFDKMDPRKSLYYTEDVSSIK